MSKRKIPNPYAALPGAELRRRLWTNPLMREYIDMVHEEHDIPYTDMLNCAAGIYVLMCGTTHWDDTKSPGYDARLLLRALDAQLQDTGEEYTVFSDGSLVHWRETRAVGVREGGDFLREIADFYTPDAEENPA